jgi:hypothetical protein
MLEALLQDPEKIGVIVLLAMAVSALVTGLVVPKPTYTRILEELQYHREAHYRLLEKWEQTSKTVESVAPAIHEVARLHRKSAR